MLGFVNFAGDHGVSIFVVRGEGPNLIFYSLKSEESKSLVNIGSKVLLIFDQFGTFS